MTKTTKRRVVKTETAIEVYCGGMFQMSYPLRKWESEMRIVDDEMRTFWTSRERTKEEMRDLMEMISESFFSGEPPAGRKASKASKSDRASDWLNAA